MEGESCNDDRFRGETSSVENLHQLWEWVSYENELEELKVCIVAKLHSDWEIEWVGEEGKFNDNRFMRIDAIRRGT
jgi:hypothetical protein